MVLGKSTVRPTAIQQQVRLVMCMAACWRKAIMEMRLHLVQAAPARLLLPPMPEIGLSMAISQR